MAVPENVIAPPITVYHFFDDGVIPNSRLPLIVYHAAIDAAGVDEDAFERLFTSNAWPAAWRNGIYPFHHYHSTAHEVLGIARGTTRVAFGGPQGREVEMSAGDAILIPAGVGHKLIEASDDLVVIGAYPQGQDWDLLRGEPGDRPAADRNIAGVPMPQSDPVMGVDGPLYALWLPA